MKILPLTRWFAAASFLAICSSLPAQEVSGKERGKNPPPELADGDREFAPVGNVREEFGYAGFVFYFLPKPEKDPGEVFAELAKEAFPETDSEEMDPDDRWDPERALVGFFTESAPLENFPVPDGDQLRYLARGVSKESAEAMADTDRAFVVRFAFPKGSIWKDLRSANELAAAFAERTGALIWDSTTRELFSAEKFRSRRTETWPVDIEIPDVRQQITIHAYKKDDGDFCRAVTLGMRKFGLPDFVLEDFTWSDNRSAGILINLVCQQLAETGTLREPAEETVSISEIKNDDFRDSLEGKLIGKATGTAQVEILLGEWEDGDAANRLFEIGFGHYPGKKVQLRQARLFDALLGSKDAIVNVDHDEKILAASERAKAMLPVLRRSVEKGLPPGGHLMLKAPFPRDDGGNEWMWVEVLRWEGEEKDQVRGILRNDPFHIKGLHAGMEVVFAEDDVFDYLLRKPDGTTEGNETGKLIQKKVEEGTGDQKKSGTKS